MKHSHPVFLVDDEPGLLKALTRLLKTEGYQTKTFTSAADFLKAPRPNEPACLILDVSMPEMTGLELQQHLLAEESAVAIIFISGNSDIPVSVRAIKAGAVDFLTKPVKDSELLEAISSGLKKAVELRNASIERQELRNRISTLTPRELEVFLQVVTGLPNKVIADKLGIGEQTIKVHRSRAMIKMGAQSLAELVLIAERLGLVGTKK